MRSTERINRKSKKFWPFGKDKIGLNIGLNSSVLTKILNSIRLRIWRIPRINSGIIILLILRNPARLNSYLTGFDNGKMTRKSTSIAKPKDRFFFEGGGSVTNVHFAYFPQVPNRQVFRTGFRTGRLAEQAWRVALASPWLSSLKCGTRDERGP